MRESNPALAQDFEDAKHAAECNSKFIRFSGRFPLTAVGDVNTYALFTEHFSSLMNARGQAGLIVPTGIATDDTTKDFFGNLVEKRAVANLYDFENREKLFPAVDSRMKFCLLTLSGTPVKQAQFVFFATRVEHLRDERRRFTLDPTEIALFNPNTRTMPVFRTRADAELTRYIYQRVPVLVNERTGENPWGVKFLAMFHMSNDSHLFITEPREGYVRLYEAKMFWQYDHRWATFSSSNLKIVKNNTLDIVIPKYWVPDSEVRQRKKEYSLRFWLAFRNICRSNDERTSIFSILPNVGVGNSATLLLTSINQASFISCLLANFNSLVLDYITRQKISEINLNFFIVKQLPVLPLEAYIPAGIEFISSRVLELVYTAFDLQSFAEDMGYHGEPFRWDEDRRAVLRAELDAYYARLYGLNRKQLRYILDPADLTRRELENILDPWEEVADPLDPAGYNSRRATSDFPGETFRVLKEKEIKKFGEYRTRRLVLEAWERLKNVQIGNPEGYKDQNTAVLPKKETISLVQPRSESHPVTAHNQSGAPRKSSLPMTPQPKMIKEIDPLSDQPTLTDFGLYKCDICGKMVMGYEKANHEQEKHGGKRIEWKKVR